MIWENSRRRLRAATLLIQHASIPGVSTTDKSSYYRSATYLICTVVEGMVYELARIVSMPDNIITTKSEYKDKLSIKSSTLGTSKDLVIAEKSIIDVRIKDDGITFGNLLVYLKNKKVLSEPEFKALNLIRKKRNTIHIQSLDKPDTGFTLSKIEEISKHARILGAKLDALSASP